MLKFSQQSKINRSGGFIAKTRATGLYPDRPIRQ
jgi:hypothetical protein